MRGSHLKIEAGKFSETSVHTPINTASCKSDGGLNQYSCDTASNRELNDPKKVVCGEVTSKHSAFHRNELLSSESEASVSQQHADSPQTSAVYNRILEHSWGGGGSDVSRDGVLTRTLQDERK